MSTNPPPGFIIIAEAVACFTGVSALLGLAERGDCIIADYADAGPFGEASCSVDRVMDMLLDDGEPRPLCRSDRQPGAPLRQTSVWRYLGAERVRLLRSS